MMAWRKNFVVGLLVMSLVSSAWGEALRLVFVGDGLTALVEEGFTGNVFLVHMEYPF